MILSQIVKYHKREFRLTAESFLAKAQAKV